MNVYIHVCSHQPNQYNIFVIPESSLLTLSRQSPLTSTALGDSWSNFCLHSLILLFLDFIYMKSYNVYVWLLLLKQCFSNSPVLLICTTSSFLFLSSVTLYKYMVVYTSVDEYIGFFQFGDIMNKATVNILVESLCGCLFSFS